MVNALLAEHHRFARHLAKYYRARYRWLDPDDILAEILTGFLEAAARFDEAKASFPTYAKWYARRAIQKLARREAARGMTNLGGSKQHLTVRAPLTGMVGDYQGSTRDVAVDDNPALRAWEEVTRGLTGQELEAATLHFFQGMSYRRVEKATGLGRSAVERLVRTLRYLLAERLGRMW